MLADAQASVRTMGAPEVLAAERAAMCDTFEKCGPDAPTLCEGWTTADLAAHLVVREHRLDAGPGILMASGVFGRHTQKLMDEVKAKGYDWLVNRLRNDLPLLARKGPMASLNVPENFIHHEDVRRANGEEPRTDLDPELVKLLWTNLSRAGRFGMRKVKGIGVEAVTTEGKRARLKKGEPLAAMVGPGPEITLYCSGRKDVARVELDGPDDAVAILRDAQFGI
jgi:uncharacterized protein (TIGR03085 family)